MVVGDVEEEKGVEERRAEERRAEGARYKKDANRTDSDDRLVMVCVCVSALAKTGAAIHIAAY